MSEGKGWIGVDLDGTLAIYDGWIDNGSIGQPVPEMVRKVKAWLEEGKHVKIFTARITHPEKGDGQWFIINQWVIEHIGRPLDITATKDMHMIELWDDRCIQVVANTGMSFHEHFISKQVKT